MTGPDATTAPGAEPDPETATGAGAAPDPETATGAGAAPDPETATGAGAAPDPETATGAGAAPDPETATGAGAAPDPETATGAGAAPDPETATGAGAAPDPETTTGAGAAPDPETATGAGAAPDPETATGAGAAPDPETATGAESGFRRRLRLLGRLLVGLFVAGSFVFWAWAFSPWARSENPARLDDRSFVSWADERCGQAQAVIDGLPTARQAASRTERADQVDQGTAEVEALVADLRLRAESSLASVTDGTGPPDASLVRDWLGDWDVYIADRGNHSQRLRTADADTPDRDLRFLLVDMTEGSTYTERMDGFARLNNMDACQIPGDV